MALLQMETNLAALGDCGRSLDEGLIRTQADCFVQNSGRLRARGFGRPAVKKLPAARIGWCDQDIVLG